MLTLIAVFTIVLIAVVAYYSHEISKRDNRLIAWAAWADQMEASYAELWADHDATRHELNRIAPYAMNDLIRQGKVSAAKLAYTENHSASGKPVESSVYALELPGMPTLPNDYHAEFAGMTLSDTPDMNGSFVRDSGGTIKIVKVEPVKTEKSNDNGNGNKNGKAKESKDTKPSKGEPVTFESTDKTDDRALLKSDKYGEYLDILLKNQNVKSLPSAKYAYARDMFLTWEKGKKPNTAKEYAQRVINSKFGGK